MNTMIMVAPNGARRTKADHPSLPISAGELAAEAQACLGAGASAIHLHVRGDDDRHVLDAGRYLEAVAAIRAQVGDQMVMQITTEAVGVYSDDEQMACVRAVKPQAVSMALKEIVPVGKNTDVAREFFRWLQEEKIAPQFILYDASEVARFFALQSQGVIPFAKPFLLFVLGRYAKDQQSDPRDLDPFLATLAGRAAHWAMCAFGSREAECAVYAAKKGGHVRVGFENNLVLPNGNIAPSNSALVAATRTELIEAGLQVMNVKDVQELLMDSLR
ncbi:hypothetical protein MNBD_ALPHA08-2182 [hydrothermal vent metagenome]|uniref:3-keto-5-aminohexanoate cleavage enzyme n=1 Tax=hydrothermal vent metagenome TaxID=652676 RepID=A0A3B0R801_9ZZZZ